MKLVGKSGAYLDERVHVQRLRSEIDDWCASDSHFRLDRRELKSCDGARRRWTEVCLPQQTTIYACVAVRIEGVNSVMFGRDKNDVVSALSGDIQAGNIQRLSVNITVHAVCEEFAEGALVNV